jgi:hypothetical protein
MPSIAARTLVLVALALGPSATAHAAVFCVGRGAATHATLAQAVAAAAANGPDIDFIYLDSITHAVPDTVLIQNQTVEILGGFEFCQTLLAPTGIATLDGSGGEAASVLEIRTGPASPPHEVRLDRVTITGGGNDGTGGGLHLDGPALTVRLGPLTTLTGNVSDFGGGIFLRSARLYLDGASLVGNEAFNAGGGLDCVSTQFFVARATSVRFNLALRGGGYSLRDDCGAVFYGGNALSIFGNRAAFEGGGLSAWRAGATVQIVRAEAGEPGPIGRDRSLRIAANQASERGAGIMLQDAARLYAHGVTLVANNLSATPNVEVAALGGAIYAGTGTVLVLDADPRCPVDEACNLVLNNVVNRTAQSSGGGAGIAAFDASVVSLRHIEFSGNALNGGPGSASALLVDDIRNEVAMSRLLFHRNDSSDGSIVSHVVQVISAPVAELDFLTIADNRIGGFPRAVLRLADIVDLKWRGSIVDQPGDPTALIGDVQQAVFDCLLARELASVPGATRSFTLPAVFRDRAAGDYRPAPGSPQVDICDGPALNGPFDPVDFDLHMRAALADTLTVDLFGPYDLGALESQEFLVPALFGDGFESP